MVARRARNRRGALPRRGGHSTGGIGAEAEAAQALTRAGIPTRRRRNRGGGEGRQPSRGRRPSAGSGESTGLGSRSVTG